LENKSTAESTGIQSEKRLNKKSPMAALLLVNFSSSMGYSIVMPFLIFMVHQWGGDAFIYGLVGATYSVFQLIGSPILGSWSDRVGRRKVLFVSQVGSVLSWLLVFIAFYLPASNLLNVDSTLLGSFSITLPLILLFVARAVDGLTGGNISVANAYVADITPKDQREKRFGSMAAASNLGVIIGPALAGILGGTALGYELPVLFTILITFIAAVVILVRLPNTSAKTVESDLSASNSNKVFGKEHKPCITVKNADKISNKALIKLPGMSTVLQVYFLIMLAFNLFYIAFPVQAATEMKWTVKETGLFFSVMSLVMVIVQGPVLARLTKVWSSIRLIRVGCFILGLGFLALMPANTYLAFISAVLIAIGNGLMWASVVTSLSISAGNYQGAAQGLAGSIGAAASIIGLVLGGMLFSTLGNWLFLISGILVFMVIILSHWVPTKNKA
jgi:DHA1 family tetracycline resistance protein-like MFS transporter